MSGRAEQDGVVLAVDIGGTHLRAGLVSADLSVSCFELTGSTALLEVEDPSRALVDFIDGYLGRVGADTVLEAVAVGFPATVSRDRRTVLSTSNIKSMQNLAIADLLEADLGVPAFIDRDVNMLLRHDMRDLDVGQAGVVIGCYVGTGLGNAICIDGRILVGRHGVAGELGHIPVTGLTTVCGCGNRGCIETIASGKAFAELAKTLFPGTPLDAVLVRHSDHPEVRDFIRNVAIAVATEVNILDPEVVILGGGVVQARGFPTHVLEADIRELSRKPYPSQGIQFAYSRGGQRAGVRGAGIYAWEGVRGGGGSPAVSRGYESVPQLRPEGVGQMRSAG